MKFILIKAGEKAEIVEIQGKKLDYMKMKEYLQIDSPVTVVERRIGGKYYDLWVDDEGLLKGGDRIVSGVLVNGNCNELLVGNMLILRHDKQGNSIGLTDADLEHIFKPYGITNTDDFHDYDNKDKDKDIVLSGYFDGGTCTIKAHSDWLMYTL